MSKFDTSIPLKTSEPNICKCSFSKTTTHLTCTNITKYYNYYTDKCTPYVFSNICSCLTEKCWKIDSNINFITAYFAFKKITVTYKLCIELLNYLNKETLDNIINTQLELYKNDFKTQLLAECECSRLINNSQSFELIKYMLENTEFTKLTDLLQRLIDENNYKYSDLVKQLIKKNIAKIPIGLSVVVLFKFITFSDYDDEVTLTILDRCKTQTDAQVKNEGFLRLYLEKCSLIQIRNILTKFKFNITNEFLQNGFTNGKDSKYNSELFDMLLSFNIGLSVNKELIINLLKKKQYINNISKYGIEINNDIMEIAVENDIYMYSSNDIPSEKYLSIMCSKRHYYKGEKELMIELERLKQIGGIYTKKCMISACNIQSHLIINFLIDKCNLKLDDDCMELLCNTRDLYVFKNIVKNYSKTNLDLDILKTDSKKQIILNNELIFKIDCRVIDGKNIVLDENNKYYILKPIRTLLSIKQENITVSDLYQATLKYLIVNQYVIGQYFIIGENFGKLLKLDEGSIFQIDDVRNIIGYFIDFSYVAKETKK